jgi:hypothetical protein
MRALSSSLTGMYPLMHPQLPETTSPAPLPGVDRDAADSSS